MKIKHLVDLFYHKLNGPDDATAEDAMRVVVTALRDELGDPSTFKSAKQECCGRGVPNHSNTAEECCCLPDTWLLHEEFLGRINEILAPREGGSREAGGPTREDGRSSEAGGFLAAESAASTPAADPAPADRKHPSHETRISFDASSYDEICVRCGVTDRIGRWGKLAEPCSNPAPAVCEWEGGGNAWLSTCGTVWDIFFKDYSFGCCPSCGKPIAFKGA